MTTILTQGAVYTVSDSDPSLYLRFTKLILEIPPKNQVNH